jgi:UDP-N-acetyl-D-mannosaminuronate dehydrogenase
VVVVQADHAEYAGLSKEDFPGVQVVVDGRRVLDRARFDGARFLVVGQAEQGVTEPGAGQAAEQGVGA